jgi:hypothetical protein
MESAVVTEAAWIAAFSLLCLVSNVLVHLIRRYIKEKPLGYQVTYDAQRGPKCYGKGALQKNTFLKLFMCQLKYCYNMFTS